MRIDHQGTEVRLREKVAPAHSKIVVTEGDRICPLLAGLNRMGCRGDHCQWWMAHKRLAPDGDCALVVLAGAMAYAITDRS